MPFCWLTGISHGLKRTSSRVNFKSRTINCLLRDSCSPESPLCRYLRTAPNSIARIVTNALKGHIETVIEIAILQARQEADLLYNIIVEVNGSVQNQYRERYREFAFLLGFSPL